MRMRTLVRRVFAAVALLWLAGGAASAAGMNVGGNPGDQKSSRYFVLQVLGAGGEMTFEVCGDIEYAQRQSTYKKEFQQAQIEWMKAKKEASKRKEEFKEPKPKGPMLVRKWEQTFRKEEDAKAYAEKLQKKYDEAMEKKKAQKEETTKEERKKVEGDKEEPKKAEPKEEK
jgi:hypothetical protein